MQCADAARRGHRCGDGVVGRGRAPPLRWRRRRDEAAGAAPAGQCIAAPESGRHLTARDTRTTTTKDIQGGMAMGVRFKATHVVLAMLCAMYFITYVDRVNIGTAASEIQKELGLSNTQLGLVFSAFAYPYLLFQVIGGWVGDRFGPRKTLFWCGMIWAVATISTGFVHGLA